MISVVLLSLKLSVIIPSNLILAKVLLNSISSVPSTSKIAIKDKITITKEIAITKEITIIEVIEESLLNTLIARP